MADPTFAVDVDPAVHVAYPEYGGVALLASGVPNRPSDADSDARLASAEAHLRASGLERANHHPHIAAWRAAFSAFGAKPSRYPSSAEALISRILKGQPLPRINALVDLYNAVSVRYIVPVGGEDVDRLQGRLRLTVAAGGEPFDRDDGGEVEAVAPGEIVWRDDSGVTCRRWNWPQGRRTQLTTETIRAFFVFDRLTGLTIEELNRAVEALSALPSDRWPDCRLRRFDRCAPGQLCHAEREPGRRSPRGADRSRRSPSRLDLLVAAPHSYGRHGL